MERLSGAEIENAQEWWYKSPALCIHFQVQDVGMDKVSDSQPY